MAKINASDTAERQPSQHRPSGERSSDVTAIHPSLRQLVGTRGVTDALLLRATALNPPPSLAVSGVLKAGSSRQMLLALLALLPLPLTVPLPTSADHCPGASLSGPRPLLPLRT